MDLYDHNRIELYKEVPLSTPFAVNIEPTSFCNIRCNYCIHALSKKELEKENFELGNMSEDTFKLILEQLKEFPNKIKSITFGGIGEPLLYKKLPDMIKAVYESNLTNRINLITNGTLLNKELSLKLIEAGVSNIKISLQGMTGSDYKRICGVEIDCDQLIKNIDFLYQNRKDCSIGIKIADISLKENDEKLFYEIYGQMCDFINIEHIVPCFQEINYENIIEVGKHSSRYEIESKDINVCPLLFYRLNVFHNGKVSLCTTLGLSSPSMNVHNTTLLKIWNSEERKQMIITNLLGKRKTMKECVNCNLIYDYAYTEDNLDAYADEILKRIH